MTAHPATHAGFDTRRLIYGDWTWLVRDGLDVIRYTFIAGTVVFAIQGRSDTAALAAASSVLLIARVIDLPRWFDFGLTVAMTLIAWGTALSLYGHWQYYDKVVHGLSPIGYTPVLYILLVRLGVVPDPGRAIREHRVARISGIFIITLAVGMAVGGFYECIEWLEDKWDILGGHFVKGLWDTETDLLCDAGGSLVGASFLTVWALRGWSSRRTTVVPAPAPAKAPLGAAEQRLRHVPVSSAGKWRARVSALPLGAQGAAALAGGVLLLSLPAPSLRTVGIIVGVALLAFAAFGVAGIVRRRDWPERSIGTVEIAGAAAAGALVLAWPTITQVALAYAVGASAVVLAVAEAAALSSSAHDSRERWLGGASAVVALALGLALLARPRSGLDMEITLLGVYLLAIGGLRLVRAAPVPGRPRGQAQRRSSSPRPG
jgi:uncharacterized membrane protein HdeD (DUF308 family)